MKRHSPTTIWQHGSCCHGRNVLSAPWTQRKAPDVTAYVHARIFFSLGSTSVTIYGNKIDLLFCLLWKQPSSVSAMKVFPEDLAERERERERSELSVCYGNCFVFFRTSFGYPTYILSIDIRSYITNRPILIKWPLLCCKVVIFSMKILCVMAKTLLHSSVVTGCESNVKHWLLFIGAFQSRLF